ncbi:MAG: hypothetical protein NVS9B3_16490 [Gemmatimonadaceae bacterium]
MKRHGDTVVDDGGYRENHGSTVEFIAKSAVVPATGASSRGGNHGEDWRAHVGVGEGRAIVAGTGASFRTVRLLPPFAMLRALATTLALLAPVSLPSCAGRTAEPPLAEGDACPAPGIARACGEGLFCNYDPKETYQSHCGEDGAPGVCMRPCRIDTLLTAMSCGCDGRAYGNWAEACMRGVSLRHLGECP